MLLTRENEWQSTWFGFCGLRERMFSFYKQTPTCLAPRRRHIGLALYTLIAVFLDPEQCSVPEGIQTWSEIARL